MFAHHLEAGPERIGRDLYPARDALVSFWPCANTSVAMAALRSTVLTISPFHSAGRPNVRLARFRLVLTSEGKNSARASPELGRRWRQDGDDDADGDGPGDGDGDGDDADERDGDVNDVPISPSADRAMAMAALRSSAKSASTRAPGRSGGQMRAIAAQRQGRGQGRGWSWSPTR